MRRKTRFVCISDTHGYMPSEAGFKLPAGDVLIHAGDLTNKGSLAELRRTMDWIVKADFEIKIIVAGQFIYVSHKRNMMPNRPAREQKPSWSLPPPAVRVF